MKASELLQAGFDYLHANPDKWVRNGGSSAGGTYCMVTAKNRVLPNAPMPLKEVANNFLHKAAIEYGQQHDAVVDNAVQFNDHICPNYTTMHNVYLRALELAKEAEANA